MKLAFATMPRSGSEFVVKLTRLILDDAMPGDVMPITPGRFVDTANGRSRELKDKIAAGEAISFFRDRQVQCIKIESPGIDILCHDLCSQFPDAKWVASMRSIEKIITSHFNLKTWGWPEDKVLHAYVCDLAFYEYVASLGRLFVVNVDEPKWFNLDRMLDFLGCRQAGQRTADFIQNWYVVNPLERQKQKAGEDLRKETPPHLDTLRERHPWLDFIDERYRNLWESCI